MSVDRIRAAAEDLRAALAGYDPESMRQVVRELPILGEALTAVSSGLRAVADRSENEWPAGTAITEGLRSMANDVRSAAGTAGVAEDTAQAHHQTDIERHDAPRGGRAAEARWDVARPDETTEAAAGGGRHRLPDQREEPPVPAPTPAGPPEPRRGGYDPNQPRAADGKWTKDDRPDDEDQADVPDVLGVAGENAIVGSDQVKGTGDVPTNLVLIDDPGEEQTSSHSWRGGQFVEVRTPVNKPGDIMSYPILSPDEAEQAAAGLEDLAERAERGEKPPRPSKWAKAAQQLRHVMDSGRGDIKPGDRVALWDDETLPVTYKDLMGLLAQADPQAGDGTTPHRHTTYARASVAANGETGAVWTELLPDGRIAVTGIEGDGPSATPDDEFWKPYTAHHTPAGARELAGKLRRFARAARRHSTTS